MKCPKCSYIGFEDADRCRNCGYEFALVDPRPATPDLAIRVDDEGGPLADLSLRLRPHDTERKAAAGPSRPRLDLDRIIGAEAQTPDLPLFDDGAAPAADFPPLVSASTAPRRPLAVRRHTPQPTRVRRPQDDTREPGGTLDLPLAAAGPIRRPTAPLPEAPGPELASPMRRVAAALVDLVLLGGINGLTLYFTLRLCALTAREWHLLPAGPMLVFFLLMDAGYLAAFTTAGGQTIGKMALGLRVVCDDDDSVPVGTALMRALGALASTLCLGAGLLPAVLHEDRRAIHDRLSGTHVVRFPA
jgi:uncharacterized RDD family membrane protein YckC